MELIGTKDFKAPPSRVIGNKTASRTLQTSPGIAERMAYSGGDIAEASSRMKRLTPVTEGLSKMADASSETSIMPYRPLDRFNGKAAQHLEYISMNMMELLNQRDWNNELWQHFSPGFQDPGAKLEDVSSLNSLIRMMKIIIKQSPKYHLQPVSATAKVDARGEKAVVWMVLRVSGVTDGVVYEHISCFWWKIIDGRWRCCKHEGLRGAEVVPDSLGL